MAISKDRMNRFTDGEFMIETDNGKWVKASDYVKSQKAKSSTSKKTTTPKPVAKSGSKGKKSK